MPLFDLAGDIREHVPSWRSHHRSRLNRYCICCQRDSVLPLTVILLVLWADTDMRKRQMRKKLYRFMEQMAVVFVAVSQWWLAKTWSCTWSGDQDKSHCQCQLNVSGEEKRRKEMSWVNVQWKAEMSPFPVHAARTCWSTILWLPAGHKMTLDTCQHCEEQSIGHCYVEYIFPLESLSCHSIYHV